ncbi:hypothetical protein BST31_11130 [Mycobacterium marseillense]|nr:hypothetical protein [Mycobacterium marseillense]ORA93586.1 hypothetical protein BST31_11130 [Mycobacterium marseillense]
MASNGLRVALDELVATATQWRGLSAQLTGQAPPSPGQPFQPTRAAVNGVNAAIGVAAAALVARTRSTAGGATSAAAGYGRQEATSAGELTSVAAVTVV